MAKFSANFAVMLCFLLNVGKYYWPRIPDPVNRYRTEKPPQMRTTWRLDICRITLIKTILLLLAESTRSFVYQRSSYCCFLCSFRSRLDRWDQECFQRRYSSLGQRRHHYSSPSWHLDSNHLLHHRDRRCLRSVRHRRREEQRHDPVLKVPRQPQGQVNCLKLASIINIQPSHSVLF